MGSVSDGRPDAVDTLTAPTPVLPAAVLATSQSPHSLGLWGRRLGQSPLTLFPIALGSGTFGGSVDERLAAEILDRFMDLGGNFVDASGAFADGRSERIVGSWLAMRRLRARMLLGTTVRDLATDDPAAAITVAVDGALRRLGTDYLDLVSLPLHAPTEETLVALDDLTRAGKVRFAAASDPTAEQLMEARVAAAQCEVAPLVAAQAPYSLADRTRYEAETVRVVALQDCGFMPRQPLAGGLIVLPVRPRHEIARLRAGNAPSLPPRRRQAIAAAVAAVGGELGAPVTAVALAWLLAKPRVTAPIVSVSAADQVPDAMAAVRLQLTRQQVAELDRVTA